MRLRQARKIHRAWWRGEPVNVDRLFAARNRVGRWLARMGWENEVTWMFRHAREHGFEMSFRLEKKKEEM